MPDYENRLLVYPRGSVWKCKLPELEEAETGVQTGYRPVLILSSDIGNYTNESVVIALITSNKARTKWSINVGFENESGECNVVLCNQIQTINKNRLVRFVGMLPQSVMTQVEIAVRKAMVIQESSLDISNLEKLVDRIIEAKQSSIENDRITLTQQGVNDIASKLEKLFEDVLIPFDRELKQKELDSLEKVAPIATALIASNTENETEIDTKTERKPKGFWTDERKRELIRDADTLSQEETLSKWGINNKKTLYQMVYKFKKSI